MQPKLIRITTVPISLKLLLKGQLRFMQEHGFEVIGISSNEPELQDVHQKEGVSVIALAMTRTISPLKDLKSLWIFYRLCRKEKPLIVHAHTPKAGIVAMFGARLANVPIRLHTVAGLPLMEVTGLKRRVLDAVEKLTYRCATRVYPNSQGLYRFIIDHNLTSADKLKVLGSGSSNGIDTSYFNTNQVTEEQKAELKRELNISPTDFVFLFVGRLVGDKGINELVEAFSKMQGYNTKLLLVGLLEADLDPLKEETLHEIDLNPNIITVGFQKEVRPYFAISDTLVFPSYREGFPNVVMQAGAMELPSIVSNINGCNEIIIEGENGMIIPSKDSEALLNAMSLLREDKCLYQKLRCNSRKLIESRYQQSVVWEAILQEYREQLGRL